ncbi:MAG TPA: GGDEF domain-containing phosphodiesterase, partial [Phormidium sp.]
LYNQTSQRQSFRRNTSNNARTNRKSIVAQVGLDEFAILLTNLRESSNATRLADQIYQTLSYPFDLNGQEVFISTTIGIALSSIGYEQPEDYLRAADTAMHQSKELSKTRYAVFEPGWQTQALERLQLESDLRRAIERQELQVYYQPIVSIKTGKLIGFEALVRWYHSTRGWVSPVEFIPLAEETGLISLIDRAVLREACQQIVIWQRQFPRNIPLTISVNLSAIQLAQLGLIERIDQILQETGINRQTLKLEITESSLMGNSASETAMLQQLKSLGIQLSIDDFGTGYSSLARLHQLPIDTLKIDRSFINQMGFDSESLEIVRTIISLAHILEMDVIAEGVETAEQLLQLQSLKCEYSQGFFFSRPVDRQTAERFIATNGHFISQNQE